MSHSHIAARDTWYAQSIARCFVAFALAIPAPAVYASDPPSASKRPFVIADSIAWTHLLDVSSGRPAGPRSEIALFSPDRSQFLVRTKRGDLERNVNVDTLLLFQMRDIAAYLAAEHAEQPRPQVLVQVDVTADHRWLSNVRWIDSTRVGFIAETSDRRDQAFLIDVRTGVSTQLTHGDTDVAAFAVSGDVLVYSAHVQLEQPQVISVANKTLFDVLSFWGGGSEAPVEVFRQSLSSGQVERIGVPAMRLAAWSHQIWLSPDGRYAVALAPAVNAPPHWSEYRVPLYHWFGYTPDRMRSDPTSWDLILRTRYVLIDLRENQVRPLLDAPSGHLARNRTPAEVLWGADGHSLVVSNTYLPLQGSTERDRRRSGPAIAEIDLISGRISVVAWEPMASQSEGFKGTPFEPIESVAWDGLRSIVVTKKRPDGGHRVERFQGKRGNWLPLSGRNEDASEVYTIAVSEGLNERPKLYAKEHGCACTKLLFDPNPAADSLLFGRGEILEWKDGNGIKWRGALVLPPDDATGKPYPLVVQTHGLRADEFLIDGPSGGTTAMAAQALANTGIAVLQVEDNREALTSDAREAPLFAEGFRAAIESLVSKGLADRERIGLIGFSRTGHHVLQLLAEHRDLLTAATIADAMQIGYLNHLLLVNYPDEVGKQVRELSGGSPDPGDIAGWMARNPTYKLPQTSAAVRLEAIGPGAAIATWETYALLQNAGRAVDFIYFPQGSHVLLKPTERLGSQGGNVDWFRFWLQGYEDPDPSKGDQYTRWRRLRAAQRAALSPPNHAAAR